jgi:hypothetical protein
MNEFYFTVKDGKRTWLDREKMVAFMDSLPDGLYRMPIEMDARTTCERQRAFYFGYLLPPIMKEQQDPEHEIHELMKKEYSGGKSVFSEKSKFTDAQREIFIQKVRMLYSSILGYLLPERSKPE